MNDTSVSATSVSALAKASPAKAGPRAAKRSPPTASREAQRLAAAILEVLAGVRAPAEAASALGTSLPRYYIMEQRALTGLLAACEPRPVGKTPNAQHRIAVLEKELARCKQDCARQQALARAEQRIIGLPSPAPAKPATKAGGKAAGKKSRKRRPTVRALKAATALKTAALAEHVEDSDGSDPSLPNTPTPLAPALTGS
jgi:hypothetical protein